MYPSRGRISPGFARQITRPRVQRSPSPKIAHALFHTSSAAPDHPTIVMDLLSDTPSPPRETHSPENQDDGDLIDLENDYQGSSPLPSPSMSNGVLPCVEEGGDFEEGDTADDGEDDSDDAEEDLDEFSTTKTSGDAILRDSEYPHTPPIQQEEMYACATTNLTVIESMQRPVSPLAREVNAGEEGAIEEEAAESKPLAEAECFSDREMGSVPVVEVPLNAPWRAWNLAPGPKEPPATPQATSAEPLPLSPPGEDIPDPLPEAAQVNNPRGGGSHSPNVSEASNDAVSGEPAIESREASSDENWVGIGEVTELNLGELDTLQEEFIGGTGGDQEAFDQNWAQEVEDPVVDDLAEELASMSTGLQLDDQSANDEAVRSSGAGLEYRDKLNQEDLVSELETEGPPEEVWHEPIGNMLDPRSREWITLPQTRSAKRKLLLEIFLHYTAMIFPYTLKLEIKDIFPYYPQSIGSVAAYLLGISEEVWTQLFTIYETSRLIKAQHKKLRAETLARTKAVIEEWYVTEGFQKLPETYKESLAVLHNERRDMRKTMVKRLLEDRMMKSQRWIRFIFQLDEDSSELMETKYDVLVKNVVRLVESCFEDKKTLTEEFEDLKDLEQDLMDLVEKELIGSFGKLKITVD